jgi:hypothetical protein
MNKYLKVYLTSLLTVLLVVSAISEARAAQCFTNCQSDIRGNQMCYTSCN